MKTERLLSISRSRVIVDLVIRLATRRPSGHQIETFSFVNDTGMAVDELVVAFDVRNVETQQFSANR